MEWVLSLPALLVLGWAIAGLLWWHRRRGVIFQPMVPWAMTGLALVAAAMGLMLATLPAPPADQFVRAALLIEGVLGFVMLRRDLTRRSDHGRR